MNSNDADMNQEWPNWIDRYRYRLGLFVLILLFLLYACLVYVSGRRPLSPPEQASSAVLGVIVSGAVGVMLGIPLAKRKVKIASQLRRAYGISQALRNIQMDLDQATGRMKHRDSITDPIVLTEFWEEIASNLRTALRVPIFETERMVEDWGEMDPEERNRIREEEKRKNIELQQLSVEIASAKSVERDLEGVDKVGVNLAASIEHLEQRMRELQEVQPAHLASSASGAARILRNSGQYQEAVQAYDTIIQRNPKVHTNYIGRAKAHYLAGKKAAALADLDTAKSMFADDPAIENLRREITAGEAVTTALPTTPAEEASLGHKDLSCGDGVLAENHYIRAEELGWSPYSSNFNRAMAKCLQGNLVASEHILEEYHESSESYMAVNKEGLLTICAALGKQPNQDHMDILRTLMEQNQFNYGKSPLRFLEIGLQIKVPERRADLAPIFDLLKARNNAINCAPTSAPYSTAPRRAQ